VKKTCPACGEAVRESARFCAYCEHEFGASAFPADLSRGARRAKGTTLVRLGIALMVLGVLAAAAAIFVG